MQQDSQESAQDLTQQDRAPVQEIAQEAPQQPEQSLEQPSLLEQPVLEQSAIEQTPLEQPALDQAEILDLPPIFNSQDFQSLPTLPTLDAPLNKLPSQQGIADPLMPSHVEEEEHLSIKDTDIAIKKEQEATPIEETPQPAPSQEEQEILDNEAVMDPDHVF